MEQESMRPHTRRAQLWNQIYLGLDQIRASTGMMDQMGSNTYFIWRALWDLHERLSELEHGSEPK